MTLLIAEAHARARAPERLIERFREHMVGHGLDVAGPVADSRVAFPGCVALLRLAEGGVALRIEADTPDWLADAKNIVSGHLDAFCPDEVLGIVWQGHGVTAGDARPHNFRALRVAAVENVTPRMRRLRLEGQDIARYAGVQQMHVKILMPPKGEEPVWPRVSPSGQPLMDASLRRRTYTIRRIDPAAGWLEIDFVVHGDEGPGSAFALRAEPGDWMGIMGPGGGGIPCDGWALIAGDETALPAIARALEAMPAGAQGLALIEVADAGERQALSHPARVEVCWLYRDGAHYGTRLLEAVRTATPPAGTAVSCWAACENTAARAIRDHWGEACGLPRSRFRAVSYWRHGVGDGEG
ncbi:siderophore-interacting protein [Roseomonas populi]|uniref:Siderophore-interacting protein n=1 Tax=Roseomonas populi TaxID=3121582 RepID=A0ABT1X537_9PROT|nr:siderophore-interacting protein [Roseomonas pecuniae]MCR0983220.1 siderophore-interacting protein [Roseomonas pecuniae]